MQGPMCDTPWLPGGDRLHNIQPAVVGFQALYDSGRGVFGQLHCSQMGNGRRGYMCVAQACVARSAHRRLWDSQASYS